TALAIAALAAWVVPQGPILALTGAIVQAVYRPTIKGLESLDVDGPLLIVPNHRSFLDVVLLTAYSPRPLSFAIDATWSKVWWVRIFTYLFDVIPINQTQPLSFRELVAAVEAGRALVIFPEGRITTTGSIMKIHDGPGLVAAKCQVPIVPVIFQGLEFTVFGRLRKNLWTRPRGEPMAMTVFPPRPLNVTRLPGERSKDFRRRLSGAIYDVLLDASFKTRDCRKNLWRALNEAAKSYGPKRRIIEDGDRRPLTYAGFIRRARVLGRRLAALTEPGEKVGLLLPNGLALAAAVFGLWAGGRVPVVLNFSQGRGHLKSALATAQVKTLVSAKRFLAAVGPSLGLAGLAVETVLLDELSFSFGDKLKGLFWRGRPAAPESLAAVLFTSGSEASPKGVALSHENLLSNILQARCLVPVNADDVLFNSMPCFHAFGLNIGLVLPLVSGIRSFCYVSPLRLKAIPELIYDSQATVIIGSDSFAAAWARNAHPYDFFKARLVILGAEKIQSRTMDLYFKKFGLKLYEGYGVTEISPIVAVNTPLRSRIGSVGQFLPGMEWRLEPVEGLESGGRLLIKGPSVMMGYINPENPGQIEPPEGGWHDTGDVVEVDPEGYVWIKGRLKRFAKIKGEMISLALLEEVAAQTFPEEKTAVLAIPDEERGERLLLVSQNPAPDLAKLRQAILARGLTEISCPKQHLAVPEIPLAPMGKIDFLKLAEIAKAALENLPNSER
ncbi:MAG: AMP-binding protein, partial [Deltaproteobacteria bacterium]|nr:AMP-binding protein [Deltaproteobacteria bacterium]